MGELVRTTLPWGTRATGLGIANDFVVPATQTKIPGWPNHVVGPNGLNGHSGILVSPAAKAIAYDQLRDGPPTCPTTWDTWGPRTARLITWTEEGLAKALALLVP
jgi:hypothetical protein